MRLALKALLGNSRRSLHVVVISGLSVVIIFFCFSVTGGFLNQITGLIEGYSATDIFVVMEEGQSLSESRIDESLQSHFTENITVSPVVYLRTDISAPNGRGIIDVWGIDPTSFSSVRGGIRSSAYTENGAYVGYIIARKFGVKIGDTIQVTSPGGELSFQVIGIYRIGTNYDGGVLVSHSVSRILRPMDGYYSFLELKVDSPSQFISEFNDDTFDGLTITPGLAMTGYVHAVSIEIYENLTILSLIITFLAFVSITRTLTIIVVESEPEFRVLRSLGVSNRGIFALIIWDSMILCLTGGILGIVVSVIATNTILLTLFTVFRTGYILPYFNWSLGGQLIAVSILVGVIGGMIPALRGVRTQSIVLE
jgi:ABC-type lipoprotein release transport system permease subunit